MRLIDSHCHLQAEQFAADADEVIAAARAAGVERILVPGWDGPSSEAAIRLALAHPWLDAASGIHPHAAAGDPSAWDVIERAAQDLVVVAIGETGLDYDRLFAPVADQLANLRRHLNLAIELGKPAILHCRSAAGRHDAQDDMIVELRTAGHGGPASASAFGGRPSAILHSFSGPLDYARAALDLGLAISFSGLSFRRGEETTAEVASLVPQERLLVETDSPYLSPPGAPRRRNEPTWVQVTAAWLADLREASGESLGDQLVAAYDRTLPRHSPGRAPSEPEHAAA